MPARYVLVDQSPAVRQVLRRQVQQCHAGLPAFAESSSGSEAFATLADPELPTAVFTGLRLANGERGIHFVERLLEQHPGLPVVVCTSLPPEDPDVRLALDLGARAYLAKPTRVEDVRRVLRSIEADAGRAGQIL